MKLQSPCPVTLPLLQSFLSKANHSCPDNLSACLDFVEHTAVHDSLFEMDLSGEWSFYMGAAEKASFSGETVTLPGTMDENGKGYDNRNCLSIRHLNRDYVYTGPATYQRTFTLPSSWSNRRIVLELERTKKTRVLLDGVSVGPRQTSYTTPHRYDITPFCRAGAAHTLTIEVDNSASDMPHALYSTLLEGEAWSHQITEHTQTNWNGITGQLQLTALPGYAVSSMAVRPDVVSHRASVRAVLSRPADCTSEQLVLVKISANSLTGEHQTAPQWLAVHFPAGESEICLSALHDMGEHPLLWDEFCPNLYRMTLSVYCIQDGVLRSAERCEDFGMLSFTVGEHDGGRQFFINGRPTILRGGINCAVFPRTGYPPTDLNTWMQLFQLYKDYGLNHVRFHTWIPPRSAFQAADRLGLYLYVELPQWGRRMFGDVYQGDMSDVHYYEDDTRKIFNEYANSPSFVMFALGNEERIGFYYYEEFLKFCKELEPALLYSDIAGHSTYPPSADFAAKFLDPDYLPLVNAKNDWDYTDTVYAAPIAITGHEVGQLQVYPNYDKELPTYETAVLKPRNLEYFQQLLAQAGLAGRSADFSAATGKLAAMLYRYFTESYLRTPGAGGFTLLGLQDFPGQGTALIGLVDSFGNNKGAVEPQAFRQSCCELTVLAKMERFVWQSAEPFCAEIVASNYSASDACMDVHWSLEKDDGTAISDGCFSGVSLTQGSVTACGCVKTILPDEQAPCTLTLKLRLSGSCKAPFAPLINEYRLWLYPAKAPKAPAHLCISRSFDEQAKKALAEGQTVLIISEGTASAMPSSRAVSFRPDFWSPMFHTDCPDGYSLGVFIDKEHPLFRNFPTDLFADWQWYESLQNARGLLINDLPVELRPMVQPIATIDLADRLALMMEARVGTGRVFVCTIDLLQKQDAASRTLLDAIYTYLSGPHFCPQTSLSADALGRLLPVLDLTGIQLSGPHALHTGEKASCSVVFLDSHGVRPAPENAEVFLRSQNPSVVSVGDNGTMHALHSGIAKITAHCTRAGNSFEADLVVCVDEQIAAPLPLSGAVLTASSTNPEHPLSNLFKRDPSAFWQSNYLDRTQRMPQWLCVELPEEAVISAMVCGAWHGHPRGAILRAAVSLSRDGVTFEEVCRREWGEDSVADDRLFAFPAQRARFVRLTIEWAVMFTGDSNAVSISHLSLYGEPVLSTVEERAVCEVRYGTSLEKALKAANLPSQVSVTLSNGETCAADVVWTHGPYRADIASVYEVSGPLFAENIANPGKIRAKQLIRVLPKDMTTPPDKTAFYEALRRMQEAVSNAHGEVRQQLEHLLTQAESFNALTGAVQHDADVWTERLHDALDCASASLQEQID